MGLKSQMTQALGVQRPGNIGDYSSMYWPFDFTTDPVTVNRSSSVEAPIAITNESAFIWMGYTFSVYQPSVAGVPQFLEGLDVPNTLKFSFKDASSTWLMHDQPQTVQGYDGDYPYQLPDPIFIRPSGAIIVRFTLGNCVPANLICTATFFGFRCRVTNPYGIGSYVQSKAGV